MPGPAAGDCPLEPDARGHAMRRVRLATRGRPCSLAVNRERVRVLLGGGSQKSALARLGSALSGRPAPGEPVNPLSEVRVRGACGPSAADLLTSPMLSPRTESP